MYWINYYNKNNKLCNSSKGGEGDGAYGLGLTPNEALVNGILNYNLKFKDNENK